MAGGGVEESQAALDRAQREVGPVEERELLRGEMAGGVEGDESGAGLGGSQGGIGPAVHELEHLHDELDVDHAAGAALEIRGPGPLLHAVAHLPDRLHVGGRPGAVVGGGGDDPPRLRGGRGRPDDDPRLHERLPLPDRGGAGGSEVPRELLERHRRRPTPARGPQP